MGRANFTPVRSLIIRQNSMASRDFVKAHARELEDEVIDKHIALFVNDFSLSLGEQGRKAISYLTGEVVE